MHGEQRLIFDVNNQVFAFKCKPDWSRNTWYTTKLQTNDNIPFLLVANSPFLVSRVVFQHNNVPDLWKSLATIDFNVDTDYRSLFPLVWVSHHTDFLEYEMTDEIPLGFWEEMLNNQNTYRQYVGTFVVIGKVDTRPWGSINHGKT